MTCLNDIQIQALADGEAGADAGRHALECAACAARVKARAALMASIERSIDVPVNVPASLARSIEGSFGAGIKEARGATRLLATDSRGKWLYSAAAVAAATLIAVLFIAPAIKQPGSTVSASEILAKSRSCRPR